MKYKPWLTCSIDWVKLVALASMLYAIIPAVSLAGSNGCVVLMHGLARTEHSMAQMAKALEREGFYVVNEGYDSRHYQISNLAFNEIPRRVSACRSEGQFPIHWVTHSLGGILLRYYLTHFEIDQLGRVVMLGPPNQGSEVVDNLKHLPGFYWLNGPAGRELGTGAQDIPRGLGAVDFDLGVIAGTKSMNLILSMFLPNPDDGKVSVESAKVDGMCSFLALPVTHPYLMKNEDIIVQSIQFLLRGQFTHEHAQNNLCDHSGY